jgi:hypothetical protein
MSEKIAKKQLTEVDNWDKEEIWRLANVETWEKNPVLLTRPIRNETDKMLNDNIRK